MKALVPQETKGEEQNREQSRMKLETLVGAQFHLLQKQSSALRGNTCSGDGNSGSIKKLIQFNNLHQDFMLNTSIYFYTRKKKSILALIPYSTCHFL